MRQTGRPSGADLPVGRQRINKQGKKPTDDSDVIRVTNGRDFRVRSNAGRSEEESFGLKPRKGGAAK